MSMWLAALGIAVFSVSQLDAQSLESELKAVSSAELAAQAVQEGDATRGAVVFFQQQMACSKCHAVGSKSANTLGPDLTTLGKEVSNAALVEAVLEPSKAIRKGFETIALATNAGETVIGFVVERTPKQVVLRDVARSGETRTIAVAEIENEKPNPLSIMPAGQVNQLNSRQQFLDLVKYLIEIRDGGSHRALQLQPSPALLTFTVPEYEQHLDHKGLIGGWNAEALKRGEAIYSRVCANCHGTKDRPGSLPTSLKFWESKFKNGSDPLSMYRTMTHGFGLMPPQTWMVPSQKYDVIHYIRETYIKTLNPSQFVAVTPELLQRLPFGDTLGPEPSKIVPWSAMDYGPSLTHTLEVPGETHNIAYKGTAVRLDPGAGGVSRGRHWLMFDTDTLRAAVAWNGSGNAEENFIDWQGIQFNGTHGIHPRIVGQTAFVNSTGPGWADPSGSFVDDQRVLGRDGKRYGPLPREWAKYQGLYCYGQQVVFSYRVGTTNILELPGLQLRDDQAAAPLILRTLNIGPRDQDLILQVAEHPAVEAEVKPLSVDNAATIAFAPPQTDETAAANIPFAFDGNSFLEVVNGAAFDVTDKDFSVVARIKTKSDGTIWSVSEGGPKWTPDGQTFFVRGGRLGFDIGWVGAVTGKAKVSDGKWHDVAITWQKSNQQLRLYVDGKLDGEGVLAAKDALEKRVVRIGFTAPNFPKPASFFKGQLAEVGFFQKLLNSELQKFSLADANADGLVARWLSDAKKVEPGQDATNHHHDAQVQRGMAPLRSRQGPIVAGVSPTTTPVVWTSHQGKLQLKIPAGQEPLRFTIWLPADSNAIDVRDQGALTSNWGHVHIDNPDRDLIALTHGGPPRWAQKLETKALIGSGDGPLLTDVLTAPETNPWLAQTRFTGLDFFEDGRIAVCTWDGDVWLVEEKPLPVAEVSAAPAAAPTLSWQRIATGMFQPLGLKIVGGKIHVICRDQLTILHDLNGDEEIDFYQCFNNDHQVTDHFHEFAMGLQVDAAGNFYYAKSGCHGIAATVPHHGTLLRVSPDGLRTDILANGFRAANGVCLNPDGSFVVTDQEGFWNPKNRINWVTVPASGKPNFYGNMLGYHDVTDASDDAMEQPLCWITNAFDRSPAELLWVNSKRWGPLDGSLLNLSYGYGKVFLVPHENVNGKWQGGMIELPIPQFPTGVMRGRFNPLDGQLYVCGMFAWGSNMTHPGGLYRIRATGQPICLPETLHATKQGLELTFTQPLAPQITDVKNFQIKTWSLKRSANYGSKHYDEKMLAVREAKLSPDGTKLTLMIDDIQPTWCMEIDYTLETADGKPVHGVVHNTIHVLAD